MKQYVVDAFTDKVFHGNQAAICVMEQWLSDDLMLNITQENNFSETAFAVKVAPKLNVTEDPVCGSGHCHIVPYWAEKLGKKDIVAYQASRRGGTLYCRMSGDRVFMAGKATLFSECELYI